jgi:hypothetical protein
VTSEQQIDDVAPTTKASHRRLPDFILIGAMKSGTTSLFRWLEVQPECALAKEKEPNFFSHDDVWRHGMRWYVDLFPARTDRQIGGEASTSYTDPDLAERAATRMAEALPEVRLLFIARDPFARMRSHYRHEVQRGRERRPFLEAIDRREPYVRRSMYFRCLHPYLERFSDEQIRIVPFEDLFEHEAGWRQVLSHLGLTYRPAPQETRNATRDKPGFSKATLWLWKHGYLRKAASLPRPIRRTASAVFDSGRSRRAELFRQSEAVRIPDHIVDLIQEDMTHLTPYIRRAAHSRDD